MYKYLNKAIENGFDDYEISIKSTDVWLCYFVYIQKIAHASHPPVLFYVMSVYWISLHYKYIHYTYCFESHSEWPTLALVLVPIWIVQSVIPPIILPTINAVIIIIIIVPHVDDVDSYLMLLVLD